MAKRKRSASTSRRRKYKRSKYYTRTTNKSRSMRNIRLKPELKSVDFNNSGNALAINNTFQSAIINGIAIGTDRYQRIGKRVLGKSVSCSLYLQPIDAGGGYPITRAVDLPRIMIVWDTKPTPAAPAFADLLQDQDDAGGTVVQGISHINLDNRKRWKVIMDWEPILPQYISTGVNQFTSPNFPSDPITPTYVKHFYKKFNVATSYSGISANYSACEENALLLVVVSYLANAAWSLRMSVRYRYTDV